jgi:heat shock protein 5
MVEEAEKFKESDNLLKEKLDAKQKLESQIFQAKAMITDKLPSEVKEAANKFISEKDTWLNDNPNAEKSEYEAQITEITTKMQELTQYMSSSQEPDKEPETEQEPKESEAAGPQIEEID